MWLIQVLKSGSSADLCPYFFVGIKPTKTAKINGNRERNGRNRIKNGRKTKGKTNQSHPKNHPFQPLQNPLKDGLEREYSVFNLFISLFVFTLFLHLFLCFIHSLKKISSW
jgi:hypothetical protein